MVHDYWYKPSERSARKLHLVMQREPQGSHITFSMLETVFTVGSQVYFYVKGHKAAGTITRMNYGDSCAGTYFAAHVACLVASSSGVSEKEIRVVIAEYLDTMSVHQLPLRPCTEEIIEELSERGRTFAALAEGVHHVQYQGCAYMDNTSDRHAAFSLESFAADGRVVLDPVQFTLANPNTREFGEDEWAFRERMHTREVDAVDEVSTGPVPEDDLWRCWPSINGFSLAKKRWGEFFVAQVSEIAYRSEAFNTLVLRQQKKEMIVAAVENNTHCSREGQAAVFKDVVDGKGGGCVLLLHGPPGVGKTLTAEATAEHLQRPLYTLTSGELGTTPTELEENLAQVLQLAAAWDAVLLVDECDIFLNARDGCDVTRNAMVGIFLRLLEYHSGILFLTSNRVDVFDAAVYSRISVALEYTALSEEERAAVWASLLQAASIAPADIDLPRLAAIQANGRQIKNALRLAVALSPEGLPTTALLLQAMHEAQDFSSAHSKGPAGPYIANSTAAPVITAEIAPQMA